MKKYRVNFSDSRTLKTIETRSFLALNIDTVRKYCESLKTGCLLMIIESL